MHIKTSETEASENTPDTATIETMAVSETPPTEQTVDTTPSPPPPSPNDEGPMVLFENETTVKPPFKVTSIVYN